MFDLSKYRFDQLLATPSRWSGLDASLDSMEQFTQVLDRKRTAAEGGRKFCFLKTTYAHNDKWFQKPQVTRPCYPVGGGVNRR